MSKDNVYYHITEDFEIFVTSDTDTEIDRMRREVGNYFLTLEKAEHVRNRILEFLNGRATNGERT